ncbi:hypothetical protein [Mangrovibacterium lignilyticum]|uniref:hypothetical protein n=1 Tax=Mangrovibacterium lignilyticum TaxID=2668052 RepID=UPI0013D51C66|nr:hypothetical protein [Mangrovibacterium lignilyticum]
MKNMNDIFNPEKEGSKNSPFDVPKGYFETFEDRLEAQITAMEEKPSRSRTIIRILKPVVGLAASFLLIMLLVKYPLNKITPSLTSLDDSSFVEDSDYWKEIILSNSIFIDDRALLQVMNNNETTSPGESDEIIATVSSELNDYEVFAELYN